MTEKKLYNVSRSYMVTRVAEVYATSEEEAEQIARNNSGYGDSLHWKEYDGEYIKSVDFNVEEE